MCSKAGGAGCQGGMTHEELLWVSESMGNKLEVLLHDGWWLWQ